ncbi:MAG: cupredoxin domain-containing protein [Deltaproteobacteria bacterium]|nr:cupredoxin domain-containing protein [Deltaproteobacteria bacterium]
MPIKKGSFFLSAIIFFAVSGVCHASESAVVKEFSDALLKKDSVRMNAVISKNKDRIPAEIKAILDDAFLPQTKAEEREAKFNLAERLARQYKNLTGDEGPLMDEQKRVFESYLAGAVTPAPVDGVHTVEIRHSEDGKKPFSPDNIIIKKGEPVRWVNSDTEVHLLSTVSGISTDKMVSPNIEPGKSWEHRFYKPGVYYYLCCIHKVKMYGKITVE